MADLGFSITHRTQPGRRDDVHAVWERHMRSAIAPTISEAEVMWSKC
jgi:hypothetical protein